MQDRPTHRWLVRGFVPLALGAAVLAAAVYAEGCGSDSGTAASGDDSGAATDDGATAGDVLSGSDGASSDGTGEGGPPPPCSGPGPTPDPWSTYGHDARRTSASNACIHTAFTELWRYPAANSDAAIPAYPLNEIADDSAVYVHVQFTVPTIDKLSATDGVPRWRYKGSADYDGTNWLTLGLGYVMADDDGIYLVDGPDGGLKSTSGVDWWGQTAADQDRFYLVTTTHGDGPGAFVGAWDVAKGLIWKANQQGGCSPPVGDENGALAVDAGVVYFAPRYELGTAGGIAPDAGPLMFPSGVYAFDGATGTKKWSVATFPRSSISVGDGRIYLVEDGPTLVARNETDGGVAWSTPVAGQAQAVGTSPPVLAQGLVILGTADHALAFDATTGKAAWSTPIQGAGQHAYDEATVNFVSCPSAGEPIASPAPTTMAAATRSGTLVVTGSTAVDVLSLATGSILGTHPLPAAIDPVVVGDTLYVLAQGTTGRAVVALRSN